MPLDELPTVSTEAQSVFAVAQGKRPSLCADFSWMFVGNAIYAGGQFATVMLLAKLLRPELVGQYALGLAVVYPVINLTNLQLRAVMTSGARRQTHFGHYLSLRLLTTSLALVIIFAITQALRYRWELTAVVLMVGVAYAIESISDVYYARLQLHDRMVEISKSLIARALLSVLGLAVATYFSGSLLWGIAGVALARAIVLFGYDICGRTHGLGGQFKGSSRNETLTPRIDLNVKRELLWLTLPLGIVVLLSALNSSIPSYFIKHALGERDLGIFATLGVCGMIISKLAGREILTVLFRPEYAERADLLPWIMAAGGVVYMAQFLGFGMTAANYYHSQVVLNILANLSLLAACYWLVARQGLLGAIFAMLIAAIVQLVASAIILFLGLRANACARAQELEAA